MPFVCDKCNGEDKIDFKRELLQRVKISVNNYQQTKHKRNTSDRPSHTAAVKRDHQLLRPNLTAEETFS